MLRTFTIPLFILALLFSSCIKDRRTETAHYTISIPSNWTVSTREASSPKADALFFENKDYTNVGMLAIVEVQDNPDETIQDYLAHTTNPLFKDFTVVGSIHTVRFMGEQARACDFKFTIQGQPFRGTFYCFRKDERSVRAFSAYETRIGPSKLSKIWESVKWKTNS